MILQELEAILSKTFWSWARQRDEGMLWPRSVASSEQDYHRILKLLEGCDILHHCSDDEYLAPALLADTQLNKLDARAFSTPDVAVQ